METRFVDRAALQHREDEVARELFVEVVDDALAGAGGDGLGLETVELLLLADVGAVADDFGFVGLLDPFDDDRGVETSRIRDDNFHFPSFSDRFFGEKITV